MVSHDTDKPLQPMRRHRRAARVTVSFLPTLLTLGNLLSGAAAIFVASRPDNAQADLAFGWTGLTWAACFVFLGMVFDGLDGRIARMTHSTSNLGEQLDSMADMVTFGVAPAFIAIQLALTGLPYLGTAKADNIFNRTTVIIGAIYVACTALRLARFNIEIKEPAETDHNSFKGLPSPGAAGTVASVVLLHQHMLAHPPHDHWSINASAVVMVAIMFLAAIAMVSRLRYVHLLNRYLRGRARFTTLVRLVVIMLLLWIYPQLALAAAFCLYAISAPAMWLWKITIARGKTKAVHATNPHGH